jgi:hypothetical protein
MTLAVLTVASPIALTPAAPPAGLKLGEEFKGKCGGEKQFILLVPANTNEGVKDPGQQPGLNFLVRAMQGHMGEVPVTLKEGQPFDVSVTVTGDKRKVFLKLLDPAGEQIAHSKAITFKSGRLTVEEVNASGKYTIVVVSDQSGGFTLLAKGGADDETDEDKLKEQIKLQEKKLAELKAKLKALQEKRSKDPE